MGKLRPSRFRVFVVEGLIFVARDRIIGNCLSRFVWQRIFGDQRRKRRLLARNDLLFGDARVIVVIWIVSRTDRLVLDFFQGMLAARTDNPITHQWPR